MAAAMSRVGLVLLLVAAGCGGSPGAADRDGSTCPLDGGADAGLAGRDAGTDAGAGRDGGDTDAGPMGTDAGAERDAGGEDRDGGTDPGADAGTPCVPPDRDGDGHAATACGGDDCDDGDPAVHPGAVDGAFEVTILDSIRGSEGDELSAAVDRAGDLHVAYLWRSEDRSEEGLRYLLLAADGTVSIHEDAHRSTDSLRSRVGRDAALAVDSARVPRVSFVDQRNTGQVTFFVGSRAGGAWSFESPAGGDQSTALALGPDDSMHVAVSGVTYLTDRGGTWSSEPVGPGRSPRIAHDADGTVHVVYATPDGLRHAMRTAAGWSVASLEDFAVGPPPAPGLTLHHDPDGTLHAAYSNGAGIVYARRPAGGTWTRETVLAGTATPSSLLRLADGRVGIVLVEWLPAGGYTLRFVFGAPGRWVVADGPACGCYDAELVARGDQVAVVYSAGGNLALGTFAPPDGRDDDCDGVAW